MCSTQWQWQSPPCRGAVLEQQGLEQEPSVSWGARWGSPSRPARAPGSFPAVASALGLAAPCACARAHLRPRLRPRVVRVLTSAWPTQPAAPRPPACEGAPPTATPGFSPSGAPAALSIDQALSSPPGAGGLATAHPPGPSPPEPGHTGLPSGPPRHQMSCGLWAFAWPCSLVKASCLPSQGGLP